MRKRSAGFAFMGYLALTSCVVATPWKEVELQNGWIGIQTVKGGITFMLACRVPTQDGSAETYETRFRTPNAPPPSQIIKISRLHDTLAAMLVSTIADGYYISSMNEDEARRVFAAIRESGGISIKAHDWIDLEVAVGDGDLARLDGFIRNCKR